MNRIRILSRWLVVATIAALLPVAPGSVAANGTIFDDVPPGAFYADAVEWAVAQGVTTGLGGTNRFDPNGLATRAQAFTFLWRMEGQPTGAPSAGFTDVRSGSFYEEAANWAFDVGITTGVGGTPGNPTSIFGPNLPVDRAQFMTMLHRLRGTPAPPIVPPGFTDLVPGAFYTEAANWAAREGIITGFGGTLQFNPSGRLTRAQAVTILYRQSAFGAPSAVGTDYSGFGPFRVGLRILDVDGSRVEVYYPVDSGGNPGAAQITSRSSADAFSPQFKATVETLAPFLIQQLPTELWSGLPIAGGGPHPLVLHSHGFSGDPIYVTNHLRHTASWGFVVVAPSHRTRNLAAFPTSPTGALSPVQEFEGALAKLADMVDDPDDIFYEGIDLTKAAAEGHSAGGGTIRQLVTNGVIPIVTLIGHATSFSTPHVGEPTIPTLLIPGERDGVIPLTSTTTSYGNQRAPKQLVVVANGGHNVSLDICRPIREQGGLVEPAGGLVTALPFIVPLLNLGEDGCIDGFLLPGLGYGLVRHLTVAQLRWAFGLVGDRNSLTSAFLEERFRAATGDVAVDLGPEP
jgi:dienelactone hydrolase